MIDTKDVFTKLVPEVLQYALTGFVVWIWWSMKRVFITRKEAEERMRANEKRADEIEARQYEMKMTISADISSIKANLDSISKSQAKIEAKQEKMNDRLMDMSRQGGRQ